MWRGTIPVAALALVGVAVGTLVVVTQTTQAQDRPIMPETVDIEQGAALYAESCAACHGTDLQGQPDWRSAAVDGILPAPPHDETGHTWHHSDSILFDYTRLGGREALAQQGLEFDSGMPEFGETLTDAEIWNILAFIQSTWPERQRNVQSMRTQSELEQGDE